MSDMRMAIEGVGVVGAFGTGLEALAEAVKVGYVAPSSARVETALGRTELPAYLADTKGLEQFFGKRELRRIDHYSKMALLAACLSLKDSGKLEDNLGGIGIIVATGYGPHRTTFGFLDSFIRAGDAFASPTQFASSVHNAAAAYAAILLNLTGPSLTISQFEMSVASALLTAWCWLDEGRADKILFGAVDEYSDVLGYCWHRFFGSEACGDAKMRPLDFETQTAIPGEGSAFFVLSRDESKAKHGFIMEARTGFLDAREPPLPSEGPLILGADGHKDIGRQYRQYAENREDTFCFSPLYGSLPVGAAFDLAIAAMAMGGNVTLPCGLSRVGLNTVNCIKIGRERELGIIKVTKS